MPLKQRVPKLKGFNNPFRVEYQGINLDVLDGQRADRGHPGDPPRPRPGPQGRPRQGARPRRDHPRRARHGPRLLEGRRGCHHGRRGYRDAVAPALRVGPPAGQGQPVHQPLTSPSSWSRLSPRSDGVFANLKNIFKVPDLRNKILFTLAMIALYRLGAPSACPASTSRRSKQLQERRRDAGRPRLPQPVLRRRASAASPIFALGIMPYITAQHHHAGPRRGHPQAGGVAGAGRGRPAQDHPVDPLPGHRPSPRCRPPA